MNKFAKDILKESMSKDHVTVMEKLEEPKHDEDIAEALGVKATIVRTILNDLHSKGLVKYERTKNEKTGWYTYLWKKREEKLADYIRGYLNERSEALRHELALAKDGMIITCGCTNLSVDDAQDVGFLCEKCKGTFREFDSSEAIKKLDEEIARIEKLLKKA